MDSRLFFLINHEWARPWLDPAMKAANYWGHPVIIWLAPLAWLYLLDRKEQDRFKKDALYLTAVLTLTVISTYIIKILVNAPRPLQSLEDAGAQAQALAVRVLHRHDDRWRFPSGHSSRAFAVGAALLKDRPRLAAIFIGLAFLTAYSSIYVGAHFPLDVAAGSVWGLIAGWAGSRLWERQPWFPK